MLRRLGPWVLALVALACAPSAARAWADATVRSARARVVLSEDASTLHVELTADLRVDGGWLEGFELDGLDEGLVLDPAHPVRFERWAVPEPVEASVADAEALAEAAAPGEEVERAGRRAPVFVDLLEPRVSVRDGRIALGFSRRHAPRAGTYRVVATYDAPVAAQVMRSPDRAELSWTLPAWRFGLDGVEVVLVLPEGSVPVPLVEEDESAIRLEPADLLDGERGSAFRFVRVHLPRTQSWTVRAELPASFRAPLEPVGPTAAPAELVADPVSHPAAQLLVALVLAALVVGKARSRDGDARAAEASTGALVPASPRVVLLLATAGFWLTAALLLFRPALQPLALAGIALLGAHAPSRPDELHLGSFRAAWGTHLRAARRSSVLDDAFDAGSLPGAALLALLATSVGIAASWGWLMPSDAALALGAVGLVLLSGGGAGRPRPARLVLRRLLAWAGRARLPDGVALAPLVHVDIRGRAQAARLRLVIDGGPEGLVRCDVVEGPSAPRIVVAARPETAASRRLLAFAADSGWAITDLQEGRLSIALPISALAALVRALREGETVPTVRAAA